MPSTTTYPYDTIVRITDTIGGSGFQASGILISPDEVLTASHVVFETGVGTATNIVVTPGYSSGTAPYGTISGTVAHYNDVDDANGTIPLADIPNDYAIIHLSTPLSLGYMSLGSDFSGGAVTVAGYPGATTSAQVDQSETVTTGADNILDGQTLGAGSSGGAVFTTDVLGNAVVQGVISAGETSGAGYFAKITQAVRTQLLTWVAQDDGQSLNVAYTDTTTGAKGQGALTSAAAGGPTSLDWSYNWASGDSVAISSAVPNSFLKTGAGNDAIQVASGNNVLDAGTGSNFLVGGTGTDTFYTDARDTAVVWDTIENFHRGDTATLWGFTSGVSSYSWDTKLDGATGVTGATLRANIVGGSGRAGNGIDASITFTGMSIAQAKSMTIVNSAPGATPYLLIYNQGV